MAEIIVELLGLGILLIVVLGAGSIGMTIIKAYYKSKVEKIRRFA